MIEDEIKIGDRLILKSSKEACEVCSVSNSWVNVRYLSGLEEKSSITWTRQHFDRIVGWIPITPETLPGDDVDQVFVISSDGTIDIEDLPEPGSLLGEGWRFLVGRTPDKTSVYVAWRPIPEDWLQVPKFEGEKK